MLNSQTGTSLEIGRTARIVLGTIIKHQSTLILFSPLSACPVHQEARHVHHASKQSVCDLPRPTVPVFMVFTIMVTLWSLMTTGRLPVRTWSLSLGS